MSNVGLSNGAGMLFEVAAGTRAEGDTRRGEVVAAAKPPSVLAGFDEEAERWDGLS
jgi:hypothetical protein